MELHLLGPIEARVDGRSVALGAAKQRAVLAMLAIHANETVSVDRLVEGLWGEAPPATATKMVQLYVSHLRRLLDDDEVEIVTHGRGYELRIAGDAVDARRFEDLVNDGRPGDALDLWHGPPLADLAGEPFAAREIRRLEELRLRAAEAVIDDHLAAGRHQEVVATLEELVAENPLSEQLHGKRMLALYRCGRQADALDAYRSARRRLVDEVGIEPGPELRSLHERILNQDPSLDPPVRTDHGPPRAPRRDPSRGPPRRRLGGRGAVVAAAVGLAAGAAAFSIDRLGDSGGLGVIHEGAVGVIDTRAAAVAAEYRLGGAPGAAASGAGSVWIADSGRGIVQRVRRGQQRVDTIDVGPLPVGLAFGSGSLWVAGGDSGSVVQVDPQQNRVIQRIGVGNGVRAVATGLGAVWVAAGLDGEVVKVDPRSGDIALRIPLGGHPAALAVGAGSLWVVAADAGTLLRVDPRSGVTLAAIGVGNAPAAVAAGAGAVWVANHDDGTVSRVDPATERVTATAAVGSGPTALAVAGGAVWVGGSGGLLQRLDARTGDVTATISATSPAAGLTSVGGELWASGVASPAAHRGGTLRAALPVHGTDPAYRGYDPTSAPVIDLAYDQLIETRRAGGAAGGQLTGGLAVAVPEPADRGRRYVFRLRRGLRYSDGGPVRASDFRASMERMFAVAYGAAVDQGIPELFDAIRGARRCRLAPATCDLSDGIVTDDRAGTITVKLNRADPYLPSKLTMELTSVVPASTPRHALETNAAPGTGPYRFERVQFKRAVVLTRNPYFHSRAPQGRPDGFPDRIEIQMDDDASRRAAGIDRGRFDVVELKGSVRADIPALRTRYGARVLSGLRLQMGHAFLNVRRAPFDDPHVRRALSLAVDRAYVTRLFGGIEGASATCQVLPPGMPGYRPFCAATISPSQGGAWTAPDLATAHRLVNASRTRGEQVVVWAPADWQALGGYVVDVLGVLGYRARLRVFDSLGRIYEAAADPREHPQIGLTGWNADFAQPADFVRKLLACGYADPATGGTNLSRFCDPALDRAVDRADAAGPGAGSWLDVERRIAADAPIVPLMNLRSTILTSPRAGNIQFHPMTGVLLDLVWVR
jgi:YVTN family beta-propeller protein